MAGTTRRKPNLKQVAQAAGVSVATVSMALADHPAVAQATRVKIQKVSRKLGYQRPPNIGRPRGNTPSALDACFVLLGGTLQDESHAIMLQALAAVASRYRVTLQFAAMPESADDDDTIDQLHAVQKRADALILSGLVGAPVIQALAAARTPHVILGHPMVDIWQLSSRYTQVVRSDEPGMGTTATRCLLRRGPRVGFVCERLHPGLWNDRWLQGYRLAIAMQGGTLDPTLVHTSQRDFSGGEPAAAHFACLPPLDGYVIPDARVAGSFMAAMKARNIEITPDQVVVSGQKPLLRTYGLLNHPWLCHDMDRLVEVTVHQLRHRYADPLPCPIEVVLPFAFGNIDLA